MVEEELKARIIRLEVLSLAFCSTPEITKKGIIMEMGNWERGVLDLSIYSLINTC